MEQAIVYMNEEVKSEAQLKEEKASELLKDFTQLFKLPKFRRTIAAKMDEGSSKNFYLEKEAKSLLPIIDEMIADKQDREFLFSDMPHWKPNTIFIKLNQAVRYICDNMDTEDNKYKVFRSCVQIKKQENGILFHYVADPGYRDRLWTAHKVEKGVEKVIPVETWKSKVQDFMLDSKVGDFLNIKELTLNEEDLLYLKTIFHETKNFLCKFTETEIKIAHIEDETDT